jgi:transposase-like protein
MRRSSPEKIKVWSERLARFRHSNQSVASFCREEGFSQPSFYQWKKKLAESGHAAQASGRLVPSSSFKAVELRSAIETVTTIRLGGDIEIQLGNDLPTVATVVGQLVKHVADSARNREC